MKKSFLIGFFLSVTMGLQAQIPGEVESVINNYRPNPVASAPNVAGFEKYGNYEVNLYTGLPQISVPVYTVTSGKLSLPISLAYHASGFKYTDQASWVGLGWSLVAGGQISRTVQGKRDEEGFINEGNDYTVDFFSCDDEHYKWLLATGSSDRQSDIYKYSFPGGSGIFLMRQNSMSPLVYPYRPIRISHSGDTNFFLG